MEAKSTALKLFLEALGIDPGIETVDDRKRVQKAVYLGQLSGVDLGYRFSWYLMGPYCTSLTRDYFALEEDLPLIEGSAEKLKPSVKAKLETIRPILTPPRQLRDRAEDWLELVASYHYLREVSGKSDSETVRTLKRTKPHISDFAELAHDSLVKARLISA